MQQQIRRHIYVFVSFSENTTVCNCVQNTHAQTHTQTQAESDRDDAKNYKMQLLLVSTLIKKRKLGLNTI